MLKVSIINIMKIKHKKIIKEVNGVKVGMDLGDDVVQSFFEKDGKMFVITGNGKEASLFLVKEDGFYDEWDEEMIYSNEEIINGQA